MRHVKGRKIQKCLLKNSYVFGIKLVEEIVTKTVVYAR